ncbi:hypothetical protein [Rufibacter latericius]|uniref:DUF4595 domain-containing protein n=1 Tax=Rufibacter latericius TaxID=2487040 RepID=A0A3M9MK11_9BACT|nr:hypothetical protein [Rufibacter latericius]RNI25881.1 hypothetical protein EFB08_13630 [Rufibacter latericius]
MKKLLLSLLLIPLLFGCQEDSPVDPEGPCHISSISYPNSSVPHSYGYAFNEREQLERINVNSVDSLGKPFSYGISLAYDSEGRLAREESNDVSWENTYDDKGFLVRQTKSVNTPSGKQTFIYLHSYHVPTGRLFLTSIHTEDMSYALSISTYDYSQDGLYQIIKTTYAEEGELPDPSKKYVDSVYVTFDGKKNPFPALPIMSLGGHPGYVDQLPPILSAGNITRYKITRRFEFGSSFSDYFIRYNYNEEGYPIESSIVLPGDFLLPATKRIYSYSCK